MKTSILIFGIFLLIANTSCNSDQKADSYAVADKMEPSYDKNSFKIAQSNGENEKEEVADPENSVNSSKSEQVNKKKIIKDGSISIKTIDIFSSKKYFDELLKKLNSYYDKEELENTNQSITYNLKIRIPADNFEKLITAIENGKDEILSKSIEARDVTDEYIDTEARLNNKKEYLKRYNELLSKAATVKDILVLEENIRVLQEEIESKEGRLKYLSDQVAYSTLDIRLLQEKEFVFKPVQQDKFLERAKKSFNNGWTSIVDFTLWIITIWAEIIFIIVVIFFIRWYRRKLRNKQAN